MTKSTSGNLVRVSLALATVGLICVSTAAPALAGFTSISASHRFRNFWSNGVGGAAEVDQTFSSNGNFEQAMGAGAVNPHISSQNTQSGPNFISGTLSATVAPYLTNGGGYATAQLTFNFTLTQADTLTMQAYGYSPGGNSFSGGYGFTLRQAGASTNIAQFGANSNQSSGISIPNPISLAPGAYTLSANANRSASNIGTVTIEFGAFLASGALDADYNGNGIVDAADYTVWRDKFGNGNILINDGTPFHVGHNDNNAWQAKYGTFFNSTGGATTVPEPAASFVSLAVAVVCLRRRWPGRA